MSMALLETFYAVFILLRNIKIAIRMPSTSQSCPPHCYRCLLKCAHSVPTGPNRDPSSHMPRPLVVHIEVFAHRRQFITAISQDMFLFPTIANPILTPGIHVSSHDLDVPASVNPRMGLYLLQGQISASDSSQKCLGDFALALPQLIFI